MKIEVLLKEITELVKPMIEEMNYEFYHIEYVKENNEYYLRLYIDTPEGISLEDCEKVSRAVSNALDEKDPIKDQYYLEVSSPGINRFLYTEKHFLDNISKKIKVKTTAAIEGKKLLVGTLQGYASEGIEVLVDNINITIPHSKIKTVNVEEDF